MTGHALCRLEMRRRVFRLLSRTDARTGLRGSTENAAPAEEMV